MTGQEAINFMNSGAKVIYNFLILRTSRRKWIPKIFRKWIPVIYFDSADGCEWVGDPLLRQHHVRMRYYGAMDHPKYPYTCVIAKVHKDDIDNFVSAMDDLIRKHLLLGHTDYTEFCTEVIMSMADTQSVDLKLKEV